MYELAAPLAAYPYVQYNDDDNIVAFFKAFNGLAQEYVDFFNTYNLADYNSELISGDLLDWCAAGIYGFDRPYLVTGSDGETYGPYGLSAYATIEFGGYDEDPPGDVTYLFVSDDVFRRVMTWNFFKGDGGQFTIRWLKRRVMRFLTANLFPDECYDVSVQFSGGNSISIEIPASYDEATTLQALVASNIVALPFQYAFTVSVV